jgi:hypothetical protein
MKKDYFIIEFIRSGPFLLLLTLAILILLGIIIYNHHEKAVQLKEDVLYITPEPTK